MADFYTMYLLMWFHKVCECALFLLWHIFPSVSRDPISSQLTSIPKMHLFWLVIVVFFVCLIFLQIPSTVWLPSFHFTLHPVTLRSGNCIPTRLKEDFCGKTQKLACFPEGSHVCNVLRQGHASPCSVKFKNICFLLSCYSFILRLWDAVQNLLRSTAGSRVRWRSGYVDTTSKRVCLEPCHRHLRTMAIWAWLFRYARKLFKKSRRKREAPNTQDKWMKSHFIQGN